MPAWLMTVLGSATTLVVTLTVTLIFNKVVGLPKELKKQREAEKMKEEQVIRENIARDNKIAALEAAVNTLPGYRAQSLQIQAQLQSTDKEILAACQKIQTSVDNTQHALQERLDCLEKREKNRIRAKILEEFRLFTDKTKNPMLAWSEMEHHAFFELVKDYEDLNGNDYVHSDVIPAVNRLTVVPMSDLTRLTELMNSRKL